MILLVKYANNIIFGKKFQQKNIKNRKKLDKILKSIFFKKQKIFLHKKLQYVDIQ